MRKMVKKRKEKKSILTSMVLAFVIIATSVIYALGSQKVTMTVTQVPNIDIVLAKSKTDVDLKTFEQDVLTSLSNKGISKDKVKVSAIEAQREVATDSFEWQTDTMNHNIGSITLGTGSGNNVSMTGNTTRSGKNAIYIIPTGNQEQEFNFNYNIDFGDSFNAAGMLLRVEKKLNDAGKETLYGYMLSFNNTVSTWYTQSENSNGAIWEFEFPVGSNNSNFTKTLKQNVTIDASGNLTVKVTDKEITITGGGLTSPVVYTLEKSFGPGYGFFSDHYSHDCDIIGSFELTDINLKVTSVKDFNEVLRAPEWRDGACKVLVNVSDMANDQFSNNTQLSELISRLMNNDIHYIGWGTEDTKEEMENTISTNDDKGIFVDNSNYSAAVEATAQYIKEVISKIQPSNYVISNQPVAIKTNPSSSATNTADANYPNGKWKVEHDYSYFENDEGQYANSGIYTEDVINTFPKSGSYKVYYEDELVTEMYAHRRPVASFKMQKIGSSLTLTSTSYDLDKQSNNNGIKEEEWSYRKMGTGSNEWTTGKLTTLDTNSTYLVRLRVKDFQDTWSIPATKYVTTENVILNPVAQYEIAQKTISLYQTLEVTDSSYDPAGLDLPTYLWTVKKGETIVYAGATPLVDYKTYGAGSYTMSLVVTNRFNKISEEFSQSFSVTSDETAPEFIADITSAGPVSNDIDVNLTFTDKESGLKSYKYAITNSKNEPTSWTTVTNDTSNKVNFSSKVTITGFGQWYLHVKATDFDGNESETRTLGVYEIKRAYTLEIQTVDAVTKVPLSGTKIQVNGEYLNGTRIPLDNSILTADSTGKIIVENVALEGLSSLKISNPTALAGYEQSDTKIVTTDTTTDKIVVSSALSSSDLEISVSPDGETLKVKYPLEKKKFNLKVTTVDASNNDIKISGAEYVLKYRGNEVARGTTEDGVVTLKAPVGLATGVSDDFILQQVTAAQGYNATANTTLSVSFAGDGSFISMRQPVGGNSAVTIPDMNNPEVVVRNTRKAEGTFAVNVTVVDERNVLTTVQGAQYKVKVETDTGLSYVTGTQISDSNGNIAFNNLFGLGLIKLTFLHEGAPTGYGLTLGERYITIENNNGNITYNQSSVAGVFDKIEDKKVFVNLTIGEKTSTNTIQIKVVDSQNTATGIEGINFEIYKPIGNIKVGAGTTDENGIFRIDNIKNDGIGDVYFNIRPVNQSSTNIPTNIMFSVHFDSEGHLVSAQKISTTTGVSVVWREDDSEDIFRRLAEVEIATLVTESLGETMLTINKKEFETGDPVEGSSYKIRIKNNDTGAIFTKTYTTDADGRFNLSVPEATSITIKLTEIKAAPGYTLDPNTKELTLRINSSGKLVPIESTFVNLERGSVTVDSNNNINVNIEELGISLRYPKVKFTITKTDMSETALLGGVNFKITNTNTGDFQNVVTDSSGQAETVRMLVKQGMDQIFEIEEVSAYPGYQLPTKPYVLRIPFTEEENIIRYDGNVYEVGDELISKISTEYIEESNELNVALTIKNVLDKSLEYETYGIDIEKIDADGNTVTGSKYDIEIRPYGIAGFKQLGQVIDSNIEVPVVQLTPDKTTILLTEVQEAIGFSKDEQMKVATVVQAADGSLSWEPASTSQDLQVSVEDVTDASGVTRKILKIKIVAKTPQEVNPGGGGGGGSSSPIGPSTPSGPSTPTTPTVDQLGLLKVQNTEADGTVISTAYMLDQFTYQIEVLNTYLDTTVLVTAVDSNAKITIDTEATVVGTASKLVDLINPTTYVTIKVENPAGTQDKTYTLNLVKAAYNTGTVSDAVALLEVKADDDGVTKNGIQTGGVQYEIEVSETATETNLTAITKDPAAKVSISGEDFEVNTQTTRIVLINDETTVKVKVESADGSETQEYYVLIKKVYIEDDSIPPENDPDATFKFRLFNKNDGEIWRRTYSTWAHRSSCCGGWWHFTWHTDPFDFTGAQRLPVFFKDVTLPTSKSWSNISWGSMGGYYLLDGFSVMKVEARLIQPDGTVSSDIYETRKLRQNTSGNVNSTYGSHTANFKKNYNNKEVEFTVSQDIPLYNHKKFDEMKIQVKFDNDGNVITGSITQGLDIVEIAVGGISQGETVNNIAYPNRRVTGWYNPGYTNSDVYDDILQYDSRGTNILNVGILNKTIDNRFNVVLNLQDSDTNQLLNGGATIVVSEKDTSSDWKPIETIPVNIVGGTSSVNLSKTYANRHLKFTITQTTPGTLGSYTYTNPASTSIEVELWLDDDGNISAIREINTPSAKLEDAPTGGKTVEYTIYNEKDYNFSIDLTKLGEDGKPLQGVRLETSTLLITNPNLSTGVVIDKYGSKLTDENGNAKLKIVLPTTGANKYYGKTIDITIREYYVPENYKAYKDIKIRVMFTSQGKIAVSPELISEPVAGLVDLSPEFTNSPEMTLKMTMKNTQITDKPSFEIKNVDSEDDAVFIGETQYQITSWDQVEYENAHITYNEQIYTTISNTDDGMSKGYMDKAHALRTVIYILQEHRTSQAYEKNNDIVLKVEYDEEGKIATMPQILSTQMIGTTNVVALQGNPVGHTMIALKVRHELKPKFIININKYDIKKNAVVPKRIFRGTSQVKQPDGTYGAVEESRLTLETDATGNTKLGFKEEHKSETILYTIYEQTGNTEVQRGQIEVELDAYGNVLNANIVDPTNPKNYLNGTNLLTSSNYINVRVETEEFRMKMILKSSDPAAPYSLAGAKFDIQNQYEEICDVTTATNAGGDIVEIVGEIYRAETMTYTIKQINAPADYDLIEDITFDVTFADDGTIQNATPIMVPDKYAITTTVRDANGNDMEIEIFTVPSDRENIVINAKDEDDPTKDIPIAQYDIKAVIISPTQSTYNLGLTQGTGTEDLGPDKNFFGKTISYSITQTNIDPKYMICDQEIKVTVQYDIDGTVKDMYLQNPTDGSVKITDPVSGNSSTSMLNGCSGFTFQIDMVNKRKTYMQLENQSIEDPTEKLANAEYKIIEQGQSALYSDTKQTDTSGLADMYVGPYYRAADGQAYIEKTYEISNPTAAFGFRKIPNATFTLQYDKDGVVIGGTVSPAATDFIELEFIQDPTNTIDIDVRVIVKSTPNFTVGIEAISETTGASITGMRYEIRQTAPTAGTVRTVITNNAYIAHADMGSTPPTQTITYEIVEKVVATGYKYRNKDNVIGRFQVTFDTNGYIMPDINGQRANILLGNTYIEVNPTVDKKLKYDIDLKIKYEESEDFTIKIKNVNRLNYADCITADFTANLSSSSASGTTDSSGDVSLVLGKRAANEQATLTITQSNIVGSYALINTIALRLKFDENGRINSSGITTLSGNYATINVAYKILQPSGFPTYVMEIEVYNNPQTTFTLENVDQGDDTIKLGSEFTLTGTTGITNPIIVVTDPTTGIGKAGLDSVPKGTSARVRYTITQDPTKVPAGYGQILTISFEVYYNQDGLITSVSNLGNGTTTADATTVNLTRVDDYTVNIKIKSKRQFGIYIETVDAYDESIKLGAQVYIRESANNKNATLTTTPGVGTANTILGTNIAGSGLTYEIRLQNAPTPPSGSTQTYYRYNVNPINIHVTFDNNGNVNTISYMNTTSPHICPNCIIETDRAGGAAVVIKIKYIPNLTVNVKRTNGANGNPMSGKRIELSSNVMANSPRSATTNSSGLVTFDGGRIADDDGTEVQYTIKETNSNIDYNFRTLPNDMKVWVTYDDKGNINSIRTNYPDFITMSGEGTRTLDVEIKSIKIVSLILYNTDYYLNTERIVGKYTITSDKGFRSTQIVTLANSSSAGSSTAMGVPIDLGEAYCGESVTYTIHNDDSQYGYELLDDIQFTIDYAANGNITIDLAKFSHSDRLDLININQTVNSATAANVMLEVKSKPCLMVKIHAEDFTYAQPIEKLGFEITDENGYVNRVTVLTDASGDVVIPIKTAEQNTVKHYTITHVTTNGGYAIIDPLELIVKYNAAGIIDENGTYIANSSIASVEQNYSSTLYSASKVRGVKVNVLLETKLGIGIYKVDGATNNPLQGVSFKITEEELIGGNATESWSGGTDVNGEMTTYTRNIGGSVQKVRYTITETDPPAGYRPISDIIIDVTFSADKRVQSVEVIQKPDGVTIDPSNDPAVVPLYNLKVMQQSREMEHIQITVKNDDKVKFKIVNLDKGFKDAGMDVPVVGSEFDVTVSRDGTIVDSYNIATGNQLITNTLGEASIMMEGPGLLEINYEQKVTGPGYAPDVTNTGFIKVTKAVNQYKITYNDSTSNVKYKIDEITGEVIIYVYNENQLTLNLTNVDVDNTSTLALNADQKIKAYYGELTDSTSDILAQTDHVKVFNNDYAYNNLTGVLAIDLGNTYDFLEKKVVFEINTITPAAGYLPIDKVYVVVEFDNRGQVVNVTNEAQSERLVYQQRVGPHEIDAFVGFGNLNKWHLKLIKESSNGTRIDNTEFEFETFINNAPMNLGNPGIPVAPATVLTGPITVGGIVTENGVYEYRGIEEIGEIKIDLEEITAAPGYDNNIGPAEITFEVTTDTTNPLEPRPVLSNVSSNNNSVVATANAATRTLEILVVNEPKITIQLEKVDDTGMQIGGIEFKAETQIEGQPSTLTDLGKVTTDTNGNLQLSFPTNYINSYILVTLKETKAIAYKQAQPITLRIHTDASGMIDTTNVNIIAGKDLNDGNGGATETLRNTSTIGLKVVNILEESYRPFKLQVFKENEEDPTHRIANVQFQVKVTPEIGTPTYHILSTDSNGMLEVPKIVGEGNVKIELLELEAPAGFVLGETNGYFMFTINKSENGLLQVNSTLGQKADGTDNLHVDSANRIVTAYVPNKLDKIGISIHKVDENNGSSISGATFKLVDESIGNPDYYPLVTTNSKGIAYFTVDKKSAPGTYTYTLTEESTPQGYRNLSGPMTIEVEYDSDGNIVDVVESGDKILLTEQTDKSIKLDVNNEQEPLNVPLYNIEIINTDKESTNVFIPNSVFDIVIDQQFGSLQISQTVVMDSNGSAQINNINGSGNIKIDITELIPGEGYVSDPNHKEVTLVRDYQTGRFTVQGSINAYPVYEEADNKIKIYVSNSKERGIYSLIVNKIDEYGQRIEVPGVEFEVTVQDAILPMVTDEFGRGFIKRLEIPDQKEFDIIIKEKTAPEGYDMIMVEQVITSRTEEIYEERILKNSTIKSGGAIEIINKTESTIEINFMNYSLDSEALYLRSEIYQVSDDYVERIPAWTTIADYLGNMQSNGTMRVYDKNGNEMTDTTKYVATGMTIKATKGNNEITKTIIVTGDVTGNGEIKLLDATKVSQHFVGKTLLEGIFLRAADMNGDGKISIIDTSQINKQFVSH